MDVVGFNDYYKEQDKYATVAASDVEATSQGVSPQLEGVIAEALRGSLQEGALKGALEGALAEVVQQIAASTAVDASSDGGDHRDRREEETIEGAIEDAVETAAGVVTTAVSPDAVLSEQEMEQRKKGGPTVEEVETSSVEVSQRRDDGQQRREIVQRFLRIRVTDTMLNQEKVDVRFPISSQSVDGLKSMVSFVKMFAGDIDDKDVDWSKVDETFRSPPPDTESADSGTTVRPTQPDIHCSALPLV